MQKQLGSLYFRIIKLNFISKAMSGQSQAGQTLLENLLASAIVALVVGGIIMVASVSLNNAQYARNENLATLYAKEGLSKMKQEKDSNWSAFVAAYQVGNVYCIDEDLVTHQISPSSDCITATFPLETGGNNFSRKVEFSNTGCDCGRKVEVTVAWGDGKCPSGSLCHEVKLTSCLFDLDGPPCP